ncbi:MAG: TonB-dependent receptor [Saprospiraceae bacterium]|nr:TonB-dependent receptor [Saprospiraceae bacterium]
MILQCASAQSAQDSIILNDTLIQIDTVHIGAYQMRGSEFKTPGSLSTLSGIGLNLSDNTNLANAINTLPGVSMQSGTYATNRIVIRGMGSRTPFNSNRIRSYLNDIPLTTADGVSTPEEIDLQGLGRIEIIKGPGSALYGSGLGGTINIYTPGVKGSEGNLISQYGSFNTFRTNLYGTIQHKKLNIWGSANHLQSDGFRENNHYRRTSFLSSAQWTERKWAVNATLLLMDVNAGIPSSIGKTLFESNPSAAAPNWLAIKGSKQYQKIIAGISLLNSFSENWSNRLTVFGRWNDNYENRPFNNLDDQSKSAGLRNKLSYNSDKLDVVLGAEWILEQYEWELDINDNLINHNLENRNQLNLFVMMYYRPAAKWNISLAAALNNIQYQLKDLFPGNGDQSGSRDFPLMFSPRIGINYSLTENWALYSSAGHGFSMPSPEETLLPAGDINPDIRAEQGWQYEIGTRYKWPAINLELDISVYRIELRNLLLTKRLTEDIFTGINAGKSRHQGLELALSSEIFSFPDFPGSLNLNLTYSNSFNQFIDFTDDEKVFDGNHLPGIPNQTFQSILQWKMFSFLELITHIQYTGDQYLNDANSIHYDGFWTSNIKFNVPLEFSKARLLNMYFGVNNITNTRYASMLIVNAIAPGNTEPRYYYPGMPGHFYFGLHFRF